MRKKTRDIILGSVLLALAVIIPYIFHTSGINGAVFLPMHIPVLIGGFFLSPAIAGLVGALSPILNSLISGMPVMYPIGVVMVFELAVYGISTAMLSKKFNVYNSLIIGMVLGRLSAAGVVYVLQSFFGLKMNYLIYIKGAVISGIPGIVIQLLLIPVIVKALKKSLK
ncbi:MAG: ECF transporter S component [Clostridiales bacterium]|nr:ECF transporter S component [Clostridiales bacterium]